ncbi:MAG: hypothetical protein ACI85I_000106 [Arenicella sp.]|jgi:hypothetical protein
MPSPNSEVSSTQEESNKQPNMIVKYFIQIIFDFFILPSRKI